MNSDTPDAVSVQDQLPSAWRLRSGLEDLDFELTCNPQDIKVSFRTCQLKSLNLNATSVYLSDKRCRGIKDQNNTSVISVTSSLQDGDCGAQLYNNGTHAIYKNIMYVQLETDKKIIRNSEAQMNFSCAYPLDLTLKTTFNPVLSSTSITVDGAGQFKVSMVVYKDQNFKSTYQDTELVLPTTATLHVGVILNGANTSQYVVAMKNCYATPSRHGDDPVKYYIIKERCPNKEDATIRVIENGVSLRGLFSVQIFKFAEDSNMVYLHCEISLCDTKRQMCKTSCSRPQSRRALMQDATFVLEFGPIMCYGSGMY
ncbi:uromodulin-like [Pseudophryne corroboree]|uniref:uromodulin-like n=1 Tax=Pseudophryne corroboree TaxID=495146 RepID=UPI0030814B26